MKLIYYRNGINITDDTDNKKMWPIEDILHWSWFISFIKNQILDDIKNKKFLSYRYSDSNVELKVINEKEFNLIYTELFSDNPEDDIDYEILVPQQALWKLLEEYDKVVESNWKKMEITFDGREFELKIEK